jgi:hypothetical protein
MLFQGAGDGVLNQNTNDATGQKDGQEGESSEIGGLKAESSSAVSDNKNSDARSEC